MSTSDTVILATMRAIGGAIQASVLLDRLGWALPPSNEPKQEKPVDKLRKAMAYLEECGLVRACSSTSWQALDRWGKPIAKLPTIRIEASRGATPKENPLKALGLAPEDTKEKAREAREAKAKANERAGRRRRGVQLQPEDRVLRKEEFLNHLRSGLAIPASAKAVRVGASSARSWMGRDPAFKQAVQAILKDNPRKPGKESSMTPDIEATIKEKLAAGWGPVAIGSLIGAPLPRTRCYIDQIRRKG